VRGWPGFSLLAVVYVSAGLPETIELGVEKPICDAVLVTQVSFLPSLCLLQQLAWGTSFAGAAVVVVKDFVANCERSWASTGKQGFRDQKSGDFGE